MTTKIGFIGMGIMGVPMAKNLVKAGYPLMVYNRTAEKTAPLADAGAGVATTAEAISEWSDVLILMVTGPDAVDELVSDGKGILAASNPAKTVINMGTVSPIYSCRLENVLRERGVTLIEAPVSGSKKAAEEASVVVLAGGPRPLVMDVEPLLLAMGKTVVYCGAVPGGTHMKLIINLLLGIVMEGLCEAINFGERCGLSIEAMLKAVLSGAMSCPLFSLKAPLLQTGAFLPQFPLKHMAKDLRFILQSADENNAALPVGHVVFQLYRQGLGRGFGEEDFAAVKKVLEAMSH